MMRKILYRPFFIKLLHWEYWPFHVVYGPIYIYWLWLCLRARSFFFFNTANPTIVNGGFLMESKKAIYDLIPAQYFPRTFLVEAGTSNDTIWKTFQDMKFKFPLVAKPDIGMQGKAVKKIRTVEELFDYAGSSKVDFLIQEFVPYNHEAGIFYYRYPGTASGTISGIVAKEFLSVTGDGLSTVEALMRQQKRHILHLKNLRKEFGSTLSKVPDHGQTLVLVPYGNHVRGAKFIDASHRIDKELVNVIDNVCRQVNGFHYGRLDVRFSSWEELKLGKNFSIIELNGAGSEPTHIYDPRHSIFFAWKEIIRHWNILARISRLNHKLLRKPYMNTAAGINMLRANRDYVKLLSKAGEERA